MRQYQHCITVLLSYWITVHLPANSIISYRTHTENEIFRVPPHSVPLSNNNIPSFDPINHPGCRVVWIVLLPFRAPAPRPIQPLVFRSGQCRSGIQPEGKFTDLLGRGVVHITPPAVCGNEHSSYRPLRRGARISTRVHSVLIPSSFLPPTLPSFGGWGGSGQGLGQGRVSPTHFVSVSLSLSDSLFCSVSLVFAVSLCFGLTFRMASSFTPRPPIFFGGGRAWRPS